MSIHSTVLSHRKFPPLHGARPPRKSHHVDWPQVGVVVAMALLSMVGYWSDKHFENLSQGQEWSVDTSDTE